MYVGELDSENKACGVGELFRQENGKTIMFSGTFLNDQKHGIGE